MTYKTKGGIDEDEIIRLKTTYRDNHFGHNPKAKRDFEKTLDLIKEKDEILWDVHANGNWGSVGDVFIRKLRSSTDEMPARILFALELIKDLGGISSSCQPLS
jgi:hypothetical protein